MLIRLAIIACLTFCTLLFFPSISDAQPTTLPGTVTHVKDGDTLVFAPEGGGGFITCRLDGIDAPETAKRGKAGQDFGEESFEALKGFVLGKEVSVTISGKDRYGRSICAIRQGDVDVNLEMVRQGWAWAYRKYIKGAKVEVYIGAEDEARKARRGLWAGESPVAPWEWRKR